MREQWDSALGCVGKENSREKRRGYLMPGPLEAEWDSSASCVLRGCFQGKEMRESEQSRAGRK